MKTIYRYEINEAVNELMLPYNAELLEPGFTNVNGKDVISIWAYIDTNNTPVKRKILVFGTGADMTATETYDLIYLGTVQKSNKYAFHIFEVVE